jgi:hypothetical protein
MNNWHISEKIDGIHQQNYYNANSGYNGQKGTGEKYPPHAVFTDIALSLSFNRCHCSVHTF